MELAELKLQLKQLIITECDKEDDFAPEDIIDSEPLFGSKSRINLDSLDALQLSLVLKQHFGIKVEGSKETRKHLQSIDTIVDFIVSERAK
ncbi:MULTISPECIES: acyl carrier protein [unclassified Pseudoalteromonas]|uniref:acyl carrier protein n=2 Tax=Bacteria TaxID=2 RepID=UPI000B3C94AC|nr:MULTISPECIES: acyl carrier protein [unclassified Pseudoalteromonas]MDN3377533.1 acyl carrier protein [Pseudoalteromonas sp. APC 3893]MDN3385300.1 acyl carrier protein [Pseudoalteromonas sp. APC 4017]OUS72244.1 acyl carrier protein [Pseudoalteromonas sp. A601]